jgi:hypothetical protein
LQYERGAVRNRLLIDAGGRCDVAGVYGANATLRRVEPNLYRDTATGRYVETRYWWEYAYGETALVVSVKPPSTIGELSSYEELWLRQGSEQSACRVASAGASIRPPAKIAATDYRAAVHEAALRGSPPRALLAARPGG